MIMDPRDKEEASSSNEPPNYLSPWEGGASAPKAVIFFGFIVTLTLAPLFMLDNDRIKEFAEAFVLLGGWHFRIMIFLVVLERMATFSGGKSDANPIASNLRFIILCTGACALPALALSYVF
mmetsp:Transcript_3788/g.7161  ORF Transcript_3788/g.7161 Transcript_3788/m.7161 type:complete len:122 (-) Transcript_3788:142-507(-)|eukprot:CAMPEP_0182455886 /NCGR_PEP_ID=MMETSP1319-20130603/1900_1 /TAXON_ID=172717 /ORGANISM="Bolidomonas pacifica, Strain RCC208" /LENGTH=121 /DNA_ID=CAMNT_0024654029 /DNA_START=76 /DNA_END=441 /DNA_ORIENTATION=+